MTRVRLMNGLAAAMIVGACMACGDGARRFEPAAGSGPRTLEVAGRTVTVELAVDGPSRNLGLMHRTSMDPDKGMLFLFPDSKPRTFWMKNTIIPLDIIFLDADGTVQNVEHGEQMAEVPGYHSLRPATMVLELNAGWCKEHGLSAGDRIEVPAAWADLAKP